MLANTQYENSEKLATICIDGYNIKIYNNNCAIYAKI